MFANYTAGTYPRLGVVRPSLPPGTFFPESNAWDTIPVVGGRVLIYSVSVRGSVPFVAPVPVPTRSLAAITALIGLLGVASFLRQLRTLSIQPAVSARVDDQLG